MLSVSKLFFRFLRFRRRPMAVGSPAGLEVVEIEMPLAALLFVDDRLRVWSGETELPVVVVVAAVVVVVRVGTIFDEICFAQDG